MDILFLIFGIVGGAVSVYFILFHRFNAQNKFLTGEVARLQGELQLTIQKKDELKDESAAIKTELVKKQSELDFLKARMEENKDALAELQEQFSREFRLLANNIFEEKSKKFTDQNKNNLSELLTPLKERIIEFERKIEHNSKESTAQHAALKEQLFQLKDLNQKITKEAENLTKALKGDTKAQGSWGEYILESILEKSGLQKEREYFIQPSHDLEGKRVRPDVIVKLPDNKNIIIDSKVSLVAYERYSSAEENQTNELSAHIYSVRKHIKELSEKNYQSIYQVEGLDFILMFIPIEPAFNVAIQYEKDLFNEAYAKNIVLVSPSTLIATLRTIANIWKHEYQNRNALEIARQGGALYDKFADFCNELIAVGNQLEKTRSTYDGAMKKLVDGKDNLIRKTERLRELGAKSSKEIDQRLKERANYSLDN